ncbi:uncharacterized protein LOC144879510 [Branchiostoma floridae x Branchiostoma japonicum]
MMKGAVRLEFRGPVAVLYMDYGENRVDGQLIADVNGALDQVESNPSIKALVTTGVGKFYSNGLNLRWMTQLAREGRVSELEKFHLERLLFLERLLTFPIPTVAAINGHSVAEGAFWALYHDYRVMRTKRGWFSLPEVHIKLVLPQHIIQLTRSRVSGAVVRDALVFGKWYSPEESLQAGFVDQLAEPVELLDSAIKLALDCFGKHGYERSALKAMKENVNRNVLEANAEAKRNIVNMDHFKYARAAKL